MNNTNNLTEANVWALRNAAIRDEDCEMSRACSEWLWGTSAQRSAAKRRIVRKLEAKIVAELQG